MSSQLKAIRRYIAAQIRARIPELAQNTFTNRGRPMTHERMPAVVIYTRNEDAEDLDETPPAHRCLPEVVLQVYASTGAADGDQPGEDGADDLLDDVCELVRRLMLHEDELGGNATKCRYKGCDWGTENQRDGEWVFAVAALRYEVTYYEAQDGRREEQLMPLKTIGVEWDAAPDPDGTVDETDLIQFPGPN